jgi:hypothetical protein
LHWKLLSASAQTLIRSAEGNPLRVEVAFDAEDVLFLLDEHLPACE